MIGLLFRIGGDNSPFKKAMNDTKATARQKGGEVGKEFGTQFKSAVMSFIGAGAIIAALKKAMTAAVKIEQGAIKLDISTDAFQELTKAAELLGMSVDELKEVAPKAAKEFEDLMQTVRDSGGIIDANAVSALADASDVFDQATARLYEIVGPLVAALNVAHSGGKRVAEFGAGMLYGVIGRLQRDVLGKNTDESRMWIGAGSQMLAEARRPFDWTGGYGQTTARRAAAKRFVQALNAPQPVSTGEGVGWWKGNIAPVGPFPLINIRDVPARSFNPNGEINRRLLQQMERLTEEVRNRL